MNTNLLTGTVTFLFTDIEGSTTLAQEQPATWESLRKQFYKWSLTTQYRDDRIGESYLFRQSLTNQEKNIANSIPSNEPEATSPG